jgi:hypothetical protein
MSFMTKPKEFVLAKICENQPCVHGEGYCILKEMILHDSKYSTRLLTQIDCVNRLKYEESAKAGNDIGFTQAWLLWAERGHAAKFAQFFTEDIAPADLYRKIMGRATK